MTSERWNRVKELFDEALEHPPEDRAAFLDGACQGDAELRAEIEQLLAEEEITGGVLDEPLLRGQAKPLSAGMRLGPYELLGSIGSGGMGEVYRARDTRLKRIVAVKVLRQHLWRNANAHARFEREARAVAALSHPHICALFDIGHDEGIEYLVMEYLEGETLAHRLNIGPLLLEPLLRHAAEIGDALQEAHTHGIIHRDLKPSNIMLTKSGAKLLDFGVAKRHRRARAGSMSSTATLTLTNDSTGEGKLVGTLAYMSPEQARGEELDARTDLFSFGAVLYEMATGTRAFAGATPAVIIDALLNRTPKSPRQMNPSLPERVERIITKALEKDRELRYQTAAALKDDLASVPKGNALRVVTVCPYRGLRAFGEEDAEFFAGREAFAERLLELVLNRKLVAVVGPSGSGKSSVVQAGLAPLLRRDRERTWGFVSFTPGSRPFQRLAAAVMPLLEAEMSETDRLTETQKLANRLASGEVLLEQVLGRVLEKSAKGERLLIVADQFEELFTMTAEADREPFLASLLEALAGESLCLLLVMRADFYGHAIALSRDLSDWLERGVVNLGPMVRAELERALLRPANHVGLEFERGLAERILNDVGVEPGNLPLLEFALTELWERRQGPLLTHQAYEEIGAVAGAIAKRAESEFAKLTPEQHTVAPRLLTRLVHVARPEEAGEDTRQRAELDDMATEDQEVVKALADARLLVTGRDESTGRQTVEVAHEALIRSWERLRNWVNEDRDFLQWRQRLALYLSAWQASGEKDQWSNLRGSLLAEAQQWLRKRRGSLRSNEREFIQTSTDAARRSTLVIQLSYAVTMIMLLAAGSWYWYVRTDEYQIRNIVSHAPYTQALNDGSIVSQYLAALTMAGRIKEAREIALLLFGQDSGSSVVSSVVSALAMIGKPYEAVQLIRQIPDIASRSHNLSSLVQVLAHIHNVDEALRILPSISEPEDRSLALTAIAHSLATANRMAEAEQTSERIPFMLDQSLALTSLAESLAEGERVQDASRVLEQALRIAREIPDAKSKCMALSSAAASLAKIGLADRANSALTDAYQVAIRVSSADSRSGALSYVARAMVQMGKLSQARKVIELEHVEHGPKDKDMVFFEMSFWLGEMQNYVESREFAVKIPDPSLRIYALTSIARSLASKHKQEAATEILQDALKDVAQIPEIQLRPFTLASIADLLSKAGPTPAAIKVLLEGERVARQIPDLSSRCFGLCFVAESLAEVGEHTEANKIMEQLKPYARLIVSDTDRSNLLGRMAKTLAILHRYREARMLADTCNLSTDRLFGYAAILTEFAKEKNALLRSNFEMRPPKEQFFFDTSDMPRR